MNARGNWIISYNMNFKERSFFVVILSLFLFVLFNTSFQKKYGEIFGDVNGGKIRKYIPNLYFSIWGRLYKIKRNKHKK